MLVVTTACAFPPGALTNSLHICIFSNGLSSKLPSKKREKKEILCSLNAERNYTFCLCLSYIQIHNLVLYIFKELAQTGTKLCL